MAYNRRSKNITQGVARSLPGLEVQRVIVRPPRLVNIVAR